MDTIAIIVALITSVASIIVAIISASKAKKTANNQEQLKKSVDDKLEHNENVLVYRID